MCGLLYPALWLVADGICLFEAIDSKKRHGSDRANLKTGDVMEDIRRLYRCYVCHDHPELLDLFVRINAIFKFRKNRDGKVLL